MSTFLIMKMGKSGFAKPEWPVVAEGTAPTLTAWSQDPATFEPTLCMARKVRADRDRRWSVGMTCQWQCGDKVAAGGLCGKCVGHKAKYDAATAGVHPSWYGLITEEPPAYAELFWGGVYRSKHSKRVTPTWSAVPRPTVVRPRLTEEEKADRKASGGAGGPPKPRGLSAKALATAMGLKMLEIKQKAAADEAKENATRVAAGKPEKISTAATALIALEKACREEWAAAQAAKAAQIAALLAPVDGEAEEEEAEEEDE